MRGDRQTDKKTDKQEDMEKYEERKRIAWQEAGEENAWSERIG